MRDCEIHGAVCGREEYLPGELAKFAVERSPVLDGKILMHAIDIVKHRRRVRSTRELADRLGFPRSTFFRYARGESCSRLISFQSVLQQLATFDADGRH